MRTFSNQPGRIHGQTSPVRNRPKTASFPQHRKHVGDRSAASLPGVWGHDFGRIPVHSGDKGLSPVELAVNQPGDRCEQDADHISAQVMHMPSRAVRPARKPVPLASQGIEAVSLAQEPASQIAEVLRAPGVPLDHATRAFMEPRFGHDFSQVRIHSRREDAAAAESLGAAAFTLGSDIFFNSGHYRPESAGGLGLLAHELAHVIQQSGGQPSPVIQRALIGYRAITWKDFAAKSPAAPGQEGAEINTLWDPIPGFDSPHTEVNASKKACGKGFTDVTVTETADPADIDQLQPFMDPEKSWAIERYTGDGTAFCKVKAKSCQDAFVGAPKGTTVTSPGGTTISKPDDCFPVCMKEEPAERARLLRHEQGHFDITKVIADNARASLKALGATLSVTQTACGDQAARDAVRPDYQSKVRDVLAQLAKDWLALRIKAQGAYDTETKNSTDKAKQAAWEADIKAGLKKFQPPQPSATPATPPSSTAPPSQAPATTPAPSTNPPAQTPQKPPEKPKAQK